MKRVNSFQKFNYNDFKALMHRINQDNNETIEKDEFCDAILPNMVYKQIN